MVSSHTKGAHYTPHHATHDGSLHATPSRSHTPSALISQKVFLKSFYKSQFPHEPINLFFILLIVEDELTSLWGS